jgi:alpha-N-arabinofuranosidase
MEMYKVHQDAVRMKVDFDNDEYEYNGEKLPALSASASTDSAGVLHISVVNIDAHKQRQLRIKLGGQEKYTHVDARILTSQKLQDHNSFDQPDKIKPSAFTDVSFKESLIELSLPPFSVVVLTMKK